MAAGTWLAQYRFYFMPLTFLFLMFSFYKTYYAKCYVPGRNKIILWVTATVSIGLTLYSLVK